MLGNITIIYLCYHKFSRKLTSAFVRTTFVLTDPVRVLRVDFSFSRTVLVLSNVYGVDVPDIEPVGDVTPEPPLDATDEVEGRRPSKRLSKSLWIADERRTTGRKPRELSGMAT